MLQASGENRLIHGARGLLWAESHQGWIWHNALDQGGNSLLSWQSITSLDLPGEKKSGSSGKELEDGWISWRLFPSSQSFLFVKMGLFVTLPRGQHYCSDNRNRYRVCFLAHLHPGSDFYLIYLCSCEMTIVWVPRGTQGATVVVFILLPFCTVYSAEPNPWFGILLVQWFMSPDPQLVMIHSPRPRASKPKFFGLNSHSGGLQVPWMDQIQKKKDGNHWTKGSHVAENCLQPHLVAALKSMEGCLKKRSSFCGYWKNLRHFKKKV